MAHLEKWEAKQALQAAPRPARQRTINDAPAPEGTFQFVVADGQAGLRLDVFLTQQMAGASATLSRTRVQALIEAGEAQVDDSPVLNVGTKLQPTQTVTLVVPPPLPAEPEGEAIPLTIVFEDAHLLVIDKPAGLVVHPAAGHESGTLVHALIAHCGESLSGIGGVRRPGIVHRLDKETSGLLVVAKSDAAHQGLAALFADHGRTLSLTRRYKALVWSAPTHAAGMVDAPLGRHPFQREKMAVVAATKGREAITHWQIEERFVGSEGGMIASMINCRLETGRTHQIRVHMAHIGHPVMGDPVYASGFRTKASLLSEAGSLALEKLGRQALHAAVLGFEHPITGEEMMFESPLPDDMAGLVAALRG